MSVNVPSDPPSASPRPERVEEPARSVIDILRARTGEAPRVTLRDEDSASVSSPVIDPRSAEKLSVPRGRGNYQFMGEVARGGMGVVLKGHDTDLGRDIAVKVLDKRLCDREDVVQRFVEEAQIGGQLQHPGIVPVYELGMMDDDRPFFSMKLVKGRTLAALLASRADVEAERGRLIDVFESVCQTIAYAHSRGVIHRDLKPANIMVGAFGEVQVVDWGLAKVMVRGGTADERRSRAAQSHLTVLETVRSEGSSVGSQSLVGSVLGTPAYMPPEQARGQVDQLDERADVFALGAILCEILTGSPPYVGEPAEIIQAAAQGELDGAYERLDRCEADPELVKIARQCLTAAPAARPADGSVLAERVQDHLTSKEQRAQAARVEAAEAGVRVEAERRSRRLTAALGAAIVGVVLVGSAGWLWVQSERAGQERMEARQREVAAARDREMSDGVNAALSEAAVLRAQGRFDEAVVAAERASAIAEAGGASDALDAEVASALSAASESLRAAESAAEFERDTQRLLEELRALSRRSDELASDAMMASYGDTFAGHGIDLDAGTLDGAAEQLTRRGLGSEVALALDAWGDLRRQSGDEDGAIRLLEIAHIVDPDPDRAHLREALAASDLDELRYLAEEGLGDQPGSTYALLATALLRLGDRELGLEAFRNGLQLHPADYQLHYLLASELTPGPGDPAIAAELARAEAHWLAAIAIDPSSTGARINLAMVYRNRANWALALEQYEHILADDPDHREATYRKAVNFFADRPEESRALFRRCVEDDDSDWVYGWSLFWLGLLDAAEGKNEPALRLAREAIDTKVSFGTYIRGAMMATFCLVAAKSGDESAMSEGMRLFEQEYFGSAEAYGRQASRLAGASGFNRRFWVRSELAPGMADRLLQEAESLARRGLAFDDTNGECWKSLGETLYLAGSFDEAAEALARADELDGIDSARLWCARACVAQSSGHEGEARQHLVRALTRMARDGAPLTDEDTQWLERAEELVVLE